MSLVDTWGSVDVSPICLTFSDDPKPSFVQHCPDCNRLMWWDCEEPCWRCYPCGKGHYHPEGEHMVKPGLWLPNAPGSTA
ncbi:MAG: hypothetical protein ACRYFS_24540 [Janthinobacterium lividum]